MERRKNKPMWVLFLILLIIFLIGISCEVVLKYIQIKLTSHPADPTFIFTNRMLRAFGDETLPLWAIPSLLLYWMPLMPRTVVPYALRWLPYLVVFLLPVFCALLRKKAWPLILAAVLAGYVSIGLILVRLFSPQPYANVFLAIPFGVECLLLVLACIALGVQKKGFAITLGVFSLLLALLSPFVSALFAGMSAMGQLPASIPLHIYFSVQMRNFPMTCTISQWPIFKAFAFLMYGLILFGAAKQFPKRG